MWGSVAIYRSQKGCPRANTFGIHCYRTHKYTVSAKYSIWCQVSSFPYIYQPLGLKGLNKVISHAMKWNGKAEVYLHSFLTNGWRGVVTLRPLYPLEKEWVHSSSSLKYSGEKNLTARRPVAVQTWSTLLVPYGLLLQCFLIFHSLCNFLLVWLSELQLICIAWSSSADIRIVTAVNALSPQYIQYELGCQHGRRPAGVCN